MNAADGLLIIRPSRLSGYPEIVCGVSTKCGGVSPEPFNLNLSYSAGDREEYVRSNREKFFSALSIPVDRLAVPRQIHGDRIVSVVQPGLIESCDALLTNLPNLFLAITVADCLPVFIYDPVFACVAAVHAGWRGSKLRIVGKAIEQMKINFGSKTADLIIFTGPSAGVCCYEVGEDVASEFDKKYVVKYPGDKFHLNLKEMNKDILFESGVLETNIEVADDCTICNPSLYHSFRRDGMVSGRMMGVIGMITPAITG